MPKMKQHQNQTCPEAFQSALDALDVIGRWEWDAATDLARSDTFVALLFDVDPIEAETGVPITEYVNAIHADDRERVVNLIRSSALEGSTYLTEYRVHSADGRTRWVLARGRFNSDHVGRPVGGSGILVDVTQMRMNEGTFFEAEINPADPPLERAADHAMAAQRAIVELEDPVLKSQADALLLGLGRKLAEQEVQGWRKSMN